jgi:hypothetical protein
MEREKKKIQFDVIGCPSWSFRFSFLQTGGFAKGVDAVRSVTRRRTVSVLLFGASCRSRSQFSAHAKPKKKRKTKKVKIQLISFGKEMSIGVGMCVPPPVTRYAGAKEENRQKRI